MPILDSVLNPSTSKTTATGVDQLEILTEEVGQVNNFNEIQKAAFRICIAGRINMTRIALYGLDRKSVNALQECIRRAQATR